MKTVKAWAVMSCKTLELQRHWPLSDELAIFANREQARRRSVATTTNGWFNRVVRVEIRALKPQRAKRDR
jgi:hypothetical protein